MWHLKEQYRCASGSICSFLCVCMLCLYFVTAHVTLQLFLSLRWHDGRRALQHVLWWWLPWRKCICAAWWAVGACSRPWEGLQWSAGPQPSGSPRRAVQCVGVPAADAAPPHLAAVPRVLPPLLRPYLLPLANQVNNILVNYEVVRE